MHLKTFTVFRKTMDTKLPNFYYEIMNKFSELKIVRWYISIMEDVRRQPKLMW